MTVHDAGSRISNDGQHRAWSTWLIREMAAAAEQPASRDLSSESIAGAISDCAELLGRYWPEADASESRTSDVASCPGEDDADDRTSSPPNTAPRKLDRFEIRRPLGHGGFGIVFLVFDPRLSREAALKIPRPEILVSPLLRQRFLREAQAAAILDHPNILPIYETGAIGPVAYILSAYCKGPTLDVWRDREKPISPRAAAQIVSRLADAVHHAHGRGVLHRDIKPSNVLLEPTAEPVTGELPFVPRLTDFGLAKRFDSVDDVTQEGVVLGTPRYMAPEQAAGDFQSISVQTDVYALGAVLYELLAGAPPFSGDSDRETLRKLRDDEISPSALRSRGIDRDLVTICLKCLQKNQADRFPSAHDLADDLRRYLAGEPVSARPIGGGERLLRWCRRRPAVAALSLAFMSALILGVSAAGWQWYRAETHLVTAESQRSRAERNLVQAENALVDLAWLFEESAFWAPEGMTFRTEMQDKLNDYLARISQDTADSESAHAPIRAAIHSLSARNAALAGDATAANRDYRHALDEWRQLVVSHPDNASYRRGLSLCLFNFSEYERDWHRAGGRVDPIASARAYYRNIRDDSRFGDWSLHDYAQVVMERGNVLFNARHPKEAIEVYRLGLIAMEVLLEQSPDNPAYLLCQGQLQLRIAKEQRRESDGATIESVLAARDSFERALALDPQDGVLPRELADAYRMIGLRSRDHAGKADPEELFGKAVRLLESQLPKRPTDNVLQRQLAGTTRLLAYAQLARDKKQQALVSFGRCRELWRPARVADNLTPEDEKAHAEACYDEGMLAQELNRADAAREAFAEGVEAFKLRGNAHDDVEVNKKRPPRNLRAHAECHFYLGRHQAAAGETQAAIASFRRSVELLQKFAQRPNANAAIKDIYANASKELAKLDARGEGGTTQE